MTNVTYHNTDCNSKSNPFSFSSHNSGSSSGSSSEITNGLKPYYNFLEPHHAAEFEKSAVDPSLTGINVGSVSGDRIFDYLAVAPNLPRTNTGRLTKGFLDRYNFAREGVWVGDTLDTVTGELSEYTVIKTDIINSYIDKTGKLVEAKYQNPKGINAIPTFPLINLQTWYKIANRYNVALPVIIDLESLEPLELTKLFLSWVKSNKQLPVFILEGYKKALSMLSRGFIVIGIPSMNTGASAAVKDADGNIIKEAELKPQITALGLEGRTVYIGLDKDSKNATKDAVNKQISKLGNLLEKQCSKVLVLNWKAHQGKGIDDYIYNGFCPETLVKNAQTLEEWEKSKIIFESKNKYVDHKGKTLWLKHQDYTPDIINDQPRFMFPDDTPSNSVIGVDGYMGIGKTHSQLAWIKERQKQGITAYIISPRRKLNNQTVARGYKDFDLVLYRLNEDDGIDLLAAGTEIMVLCPESIHKLDGYFNENTDIWLDEAESSIPQMLAGGTLKGRRQAVALEVLKKAVQQCNNVYLLDAFLTDKTVNFIASLAPNKSVTKYGNIYQPERPQPVTFIDVVDPETEDVKIHDKSAIVQVLLNENKPFIGTDSQVFAQSLDIIFKTVGKIGLVLDSTSNEQTFSELFQSWYNLADKKPEILETVAKAETHFKTVLEANNIPLNCHWADYLLENPNRFFLLFNLDYFSYTTTAESGVSVDLKKGENKIDKNWIIELDGFFSCKALIVFGVIGTNSQLQMSGRLRDNDIPFYIYCPERSVIPQGDDFKAQRPELIKAAFDAFFESQKDSLDDANIRHCFDLVYQRMMDNLAEFWEHGHYLAALSNFEKANLRACLVYKLRSSMGYDIEYKTAESIKGVKDAIKHAKGLIQENEGDLLYNTQPFETVDDGEKVYKKKPSTANARRLKVTKILRNLPGINETEAWTPENLTEFEIKDRNFRFNTTKFFLLFNTEISNKKANFDRYLRYTSEFVALKTLVKDLDVTLVNLRKLVIDQLILKLANGLEIHKDSPEVLYIISTARSRKDIKRLESFKVPVPTTDKRENIAYIKKLLGKVGVYLKQSSQRQDENGVKQSWYTLDFDKFNHPYRIEAFKATQRYFNNWVTENENNQPDWSYSAEHNGERSPEFSTNNSEENNYKPDNGFSVADNSVYGVAPTLDADQYLKELQTKTQKEAKEFTEIILPQVFDGFTLQIEHIRALPVVRQLVESQDSNSREDVKDAIKAKINQCAENVKQFADEFLDNLKKSVNLRKLVAQVWDIVLIEELEGQMIGMPY